MEKMNNEREVNPLRSEHLNEGISPIIASIGTHENAKEFVESDAYQKARDIDNVDYYAEADKLDALKFKNAGDQTYVISTIDNFPKLSKTLKNCTGIVVAGIDKKTGKNISFMSHQAPDYFLYEDKGEENFSRDIRERLSEMKERCVPGTIDAVIAGGNYFIDIFGKGPDEIHREDYQDSIQFLSHEISDALGFPPVVIAGPKEVPGSDDIFYDNEKRRLYLFRPETGKASTESFIPGDLAKNEEKWAEEKEPEEKDPQKASLRRLTRPYPKQESGDFK